ncbi:chloramphenicol phosphotransferase CPT family protein [Brachybacterium kimchii]|uniref:Chloramphenicol phosphotransferase CPT family protein n=1 Tax=Brachybacterium kimchii TaxID=2942909 RepID=A0ABY4NBJ2_9MICO|nr:chloramphenicol phosphotransferase CPT family protein [Brachybacterium kimchii]UQN31136.1 chloramphenicol phosphotransferase CPT family protein [Brachybacterium kimchii]
MTLREFGIFLNGSYGVGKSSTLEHLADLFAEAELPFSLFDVDWFHRSWPTATTDPENVLTEADNIRAVWRNYRQTGPRTPLIAGVITKAKDLERYKQCFELPLRVVHLTASSDVAELRLRGRYTSSQHRALTWHLGDHERLARELHQLPSHDLVVDTDHRSSAEVAAVVFDEFAPCLHS